MENAGLDRVKAAFQRVSTEHPPKGELWLGTDILLAAGLKDDLKGRIELVEKLRQDMICLPIAHKPYISRTLGYRYFQVDAIREALESTDAFVMAILDGPFQRLADKKGLMKLFSGWMREKEGILKAYENERTDVEHLLDRCLEYPAHGVVIADDLAGDQSTFLDPRDIERFFFPFYQHTVSKIHSIQAVALFHSCGNISNFVPQLVSNGFDGLAAIQGRTNDLLSLKTRYGSHLTLMGGIEGEILAQEEFSPSDSEKLRELLKSLAKDGGFILSSSCGLYSARFLERIQWIYRVV